MEKRCSSKSIQFVGDPHPTPKLEVLISETL